MSMRDGDWRRRRLAEALLYLCVDRRAEQGDLPDLLDEVLDAGVDLVQLRDKTGSLDELRAAAAVFRTAADRHGALFVVNDDPDLAVDCRADGVHVGQDDVPPGTARTVVGSERLVGRSTHTVGQIDAAIDEDVDYVAVGPVHATPTKQGRSPVGLGPVRHAAAVVGDRPWFVTGGMDAGTAPEVLAAGARRIVVVRAITEAEAPGAVTAELVRVLGRGGR